MLVYPVRWDKEGRPTLYTCDYAKGYALSALPIFGPTHTSVISQALGNAWLLVR